MKNHGSEQAKTAQARYVLVRSKTGLNDTLSEIEKCWKYCEQYGRRLVIDTTKSGIFDPLTTYFESIVPGVADFECDKGTLAILSDCTVFPRCLEGRLEGYETRWEPAVGNFVEVDSGEITSFDFDRDYSEDLLVHEQVWTGRMQSLEFLSRCRLTPHVKKDLENRLSGLKGLVYYSVHVRNTDYTTNYQHLLRSLEGELAGASVLICSDDRRVYSQAVSVLSRSRVFRLVELETVSGKPLHAERHADQYKANINLFTDLFGLALSRKIYSANVDQIPRKSGFTLLAMGLHANRPLVHQLFHA